MNEKFDVERAAFQIKTLHGLMDEINGDVDADTWRGATNRLWVLLDVMEPIVNGLYEYISHGGKT